MPTIIIWTIIVFALLSLVATVYKRVVVKKPATKRGGATATTTTTTIVVRRWRSWFIVVHPFWTILVVLACLAFLPQIVWLGGWVVAAIASGPDQVFRGTDRSEWGVTSPPDMIILPQGKSVGGPLRWNEEANVTVRPRMNRETLDENRICFAGILPPASWMDVVFSTYHESASSWKAVLIDYGYTGRFLSPGLVHQHAVATFDEKSGVLDLFDLPKKGKHEARITDRSVSESESERGFKVSEWYIQVTPGGPKEVTIDIQNEPNGTYQYVVEVGTNETSFTIPQHFKWLWTAPIHHDTYRASIDGDPVAAEGTPAGKHRNYLAIEATVNGEKKVLSKPLLFQQTQLRSGVTLSLNTNGVPTPEGSVKPARIIVGIQL